MILAAMLTLPLIMHNTEMDAFTKWEHTQKQYIQDIRGQNNFIRKWESEVAEMHNDDRMTEVNSVNVYANHALKYDTDANVWHVEDYWASPGEALAKGKGDCEDYAILKYYSLRQLGFKDDELKLLTLVAVEKNELHTVLIVDDKYLLDNESDEIKDIKDVENYTPIYMLNASHWWYKQ